MPLTLKDLSEKMADIDFCTLLTRGEGGAIAGRPMSNNGDVEYDGDSWFFSYEATRKVADIAREPQVALSFQGQGGLLGAPGIFIQIEGVAELIRDKRQFEAHWTSDLDRWFPEGVETPGIVLVKVHASRIRYWDSEEEGELTVR